MAKGNTILGQPIQENAPPQYYEMLSNIVSSTAQTEANRVAGHYQLMASLVGNLTQSVSQGLTNYYNYKLQSEQLEMQKDLHAIQYRREQLQLRSEMREQNRLEARDAKMDDLHTTIGAMGAMLGGESDLDTEYIFDNYRRISSAKYSLDPEVRMSAANMLSDLEARVDSSGASVLGTIRALNQANTSDPLYRSYLKTAASNPTLYGSLSTDADMTIKLMAGVDPDLDPALKTWLDGQDQAKYAQHLLSAATPEGARNNQIKFGVQQLRLDLASQGNSMDARNLEAQLQQARSLDLSDPMKTNTHKFLKDNLGRRYIGYDTARMRAPIAVADGSNGINRGAGKDQDVDLDMPVNLVSQAKARAVVTNPNLSKNEQFVNSVKAFSAETSAAQRERYAYNMGFTLMEYGTYGGLEQSAELLPVLELLENMSASEKFMFIRGQANASPALALGADLRTPDAFAKYYDSGLIDPKNRNESVGLFENLGHEMRNLVAGPFTLDFADREQQLLFNFSNVEQILAMDFTGKSDAFIRQYRNSFENSVRHINDTLKTGELTGFMKNMDYDANPFDAYGAGKANSWFARVDASDTEVVKGIGTGGVAKVEGRDWKDAFFSSNPAQYYSFGLARKLKKTQDIAEEVTSIFPGGTLTGPNPLAPKPQQNLFNVVTPPPGQ